MFKEYPKVYALHKEECEGLLEGRCRIEEKIDGANTSIWRADDGVIHCGSRTRDLTEAKDGFNGFVEYVENHEGIRKFLTDYHDHRLYGEWLVRHTLAYYELAYKQFYLFDIEDADGNRVGRSTLDDMANKYGIKTAYLFADIENPTLEQIKEFAGKTMLGTKGEGVIIKNDAFINKFGSRQHGKYVTQEFKEDNAVTFGGNNKDSETYWEMYFTNKVCTLARVQKIMHKMESMHGRLDMQHIPMIMGTAFHDIVTEEGWEIAKEMVRNKQAFNFAAFKKLCDKKVKQIYVELITNDVSVAHKKNNENHDN